MLHSEVHSQASLNLLTYNMCHAFIRTNRTDEEYVPQTNRKRKLAPKPGSSKVQKMDIQYNYLDQTSVHPESYHVASMFVCLLLFLLVCTLILSVICLFALL